MAIEWRTSRQCRSAASRPFPGSIAGKPIRAAMAPGSTNDMSALGASTPLYTSHQARLRSRDEDSSRACPTPDQAP